MKKSFVSSIVVLLFMFSACSEKMDKYDEALMNAEKQLSVLRDNALQQNRIPRGSTPDGGVHWAHENMDWTEGFWPGTCWMIYKYSKDEKWKDAAIAAQNLYEEDKDNNGTHDLGFIFNCSYGNGYKITNNQEYKEVLIDAANSLISRYNPEVKAIKSWDWGMDKWTYPVIIDNMMNLEMLFEASILTGDNSYKEVAINHANTTMKNHFRNDYSTFHVLDYDPETGDVVNKRTLQGWADSSSWARGQAWGLYGFTTCYRYTKDQAYLDQAKNIADYNMKQYEDDFIPIWDYNAPDSLRKYRDASAAAIFASGLIELCKYANDKKYLEFADNILNSLSKYYSAKNGENANFLIKHCCGNVPNGEEVDVSINYGDYYYVEALLRMKNML